MDESQTPAENTPVAEASNVAVSPTVEPTTSVEPVVEAVVIPAEPIVDTEHQPKPAERKIRALIEENKRFKEELERLPLPSTPPSEPLSKSIDQTLDEFGNVDLVKLDALAEKRAAQVSTNATSLEVTKLRQELAMKDTLAQNAQDVAALEREPELDPDNAMFDKILEQKIVNAYKEKAVKTNPYNPDQKYLDTTVRLADVAKEELASYRAGVERGKSLASNSLASLADNAAMTPGTESAVEKSFADKSLAEMEADLRASGHKI